MHNFKTKVNLELYIENLNNYDLVTKEVEVNWNLEFEMRDSGVKSFIITVPEQKINVDINVWGEQEDEQKTLTFKLDNVKIEKNEGREMIIPSSLEFFKEKWTLVF
ncbi:MAG TPA: hypothetical protein DDY18_06140 [Flavobacterium sp.]|jgi:hypothetical protein|nr:hypothetical protein [Flavobacterium sp.]